MTIQNSPVKLKDTEAEKTIIAGLLKDLNKIDKVLLNCNPTYFTEPMYRNLFKIITQTYTRHGSLVTNDFLSNCLEGNGYTQEVRLVYLKAFDELSKIEVNNAEFGFAVSAIRKAFISSEVSDILTSYP